MRVPFTFPAGGAPPPTIDWDFGVIFNSTANGPSSVDNVDYWHVPWNYGANDRTNNAGYTTRFGRVTGANTTALNFTTASDKLRGAHYPSVNLEWVWRFDVPSSATYRIHHVQGYSGARNGLDCELYDGTHSGGTAFYTGASSSTGADEHLDLADGWSTVNPVATQISRLNAQIGYIEQAISNGYISLRTVRPTGGVHSMVNYFRVQRLA